MAEFHNFTENGIVFGEGGKIIYNPADNDIDLCSAKRVDYSSLPLVKTGLKDVDDVLIGLPIGTDNHPYGSMMIVAGSEGCGKSEFVANLIVHQIDKERRRCWLWSAEMEAGAILNTIDLKIAGPGNVKNANGTDPYHVVPVVDADVCAKINSFYKGMVTVHKYTMRDLVDTSAAYCPAQTMWLSAEWAVKNGAKVLIFDNLTCLVSMYQSSYGSLDSYRTYTTMDYQAQIAIDIIGFCSRHSVCGVLVAHTKKAECDELNNAISGSSTPKDVSTAILHYRRFKKKEIVSEKERCKSDKPRFTEFDRAIEITKNRAFGHLTSKPIVCHYDQLSHRLYTDGDNVTIPGKEKIKKWQLPCSWEAYDQLSFKKKEDGNHDKNQKPYRAANR